MIDILYEDEALVAVHKPSGLLVHRSWLDRHETQFAMQMTRDAVGCHVFPVHRLDRPTSGVLLFTKSAKAARLMSEQMTTRTILKHYFGLVRGYVHHAATLDYPLKLEFDDIADRDSDKNKHPQEAITRYRPREQVELPLAVGRYATSRYTLVEMQPLTGRKHQLRRHMAHLRHPIIGDTTHGDGHHNKFYRSHFSIQRLWLIAKGIGFNHPYSGKPVWIETDLEQDWLSLFAHFKWSLDQDQYRIRP